MDDLIQTRQEVYALQRQLKRLGFYFGHVDGLRGPITNAAIIAFKKSIGFVARSYVGPLTRAALQKVGSPKSLAPWMDEAQHILGLHEDRNVTALRGWFDASFAWIDPRDIPWCGAFVATALRKWQPGIEIPDNPLGARNWGRFGKACEPQVGAVLTFWRGSRSGWQGHVGFYAGESATAYRVLGGNQRNAVTDNTWIAKSRLLQSRWPIGHSQPGKTVIASSAGQTLSTNEA